MARITNDEAGGCAARREPFTNNNETLYGSWYIGVYAVHSYGSHFPLYVYDKATGEWFGNSDRYSRTTAKHKTQAYPTGVPRSDMNWIDTETLQLIIRAGSYAAYCGRRVAA